VRLVFQCRLFQRKSLFPAFANLDAHLWLAAFQPQSNPILMFADRYDRSVDLVPRLVHGFSHNRQHGKQPPLVTFPRFGILFVNGQDKLAAVAIGRIFPTGFHTVSKDRIIGIEGEFRGRSEIVKDSPEGFDRIEGAALFEIFTPAAMEIQTRC